MCRVSVGFGVAGSLRGSFASCSRSDSSGLYSILSGLISGYSVSQMRALLADWIRRNRSNDFFGWSIYAWAVSIFCCHRQFDVGASCRPSKFESYCRRLAALPEFKGCPSLMGSELELFVWHKVC